ncbi:hypothetical protein Tdes44962_MAKER02371 [Teratosphaeria destructans]|uniref:Uncharacterized protein n=1 Tax=Teratosphaeria destructans TaxID=418781 RepID=A0A9W7STN9_9PEZI|nr:hypothetical protein Tdes44962_MAKER02371 [Teratosphaeria destructans]
MAGTSQNAAAGPSPRPPGPSPRPEEFFKEKARQRQQPEWNNYAPEPRPRQRPETQEYQDDARGRQYSLSRLPSSPRSSTSSSRSPSPVRRPGRGRYDAPQYRRYPRKDSGEHSRSRSSRPRSTPDEDEEGELPWFKRKELWATVASIAGVAAATWSANATRQSAHATQASAQATQASARATREAAMASHRSADAAHRSADASTRIANGNDLQTRAAVNTAVASGHQDHRGHYLGPLPTDPHAIRPPRPRRRSWERAMNIGEKEHRSSPSRYGRDSRSSAGSGRSHRSRRHEPGLLQQALAKV